VKSLPQVHDGDTVEEVLEGVIAARRAGTDPKELFGGPRDWVDSMLPPAAFVLVNVVAGLRAGVWAAAIAEVAVVAVRLAKRETLRHAFSGAVGVGVAIGFALWMHSAKAFFLPGIVTNAAYGALFLVSALTSYPLVGVIMKVLYDKPKAWHEHPRVRRAYREATFGWAGMFLLRVAVTGTLYRMDKVGWLAVAKIAMGYPLYLGALAVTLPFVKWRTADVPVPEAEPESGPGEEETESSGEHAGADAP
jgi:hypothetical protein